MSGVYHTNADVPPQTADGLENILRAQESVCDQTWPFPDWRGSAVLDGSDSYAN